MISFPSENLDIIEYSLTTLTRGFTLKEFLTAMKTWDVIIPPLFVGIPIGERSINNQEYSNNDMIISKLIKKSAKNQSEIALDIVFNSVQPYILFLILLFYFMK